MDSQREINLIESQHDLPGQVAERPAQSRVRSAMGEIDLAAAQTELLCQAAEDQEAACAWAADQAMQDDEVYMQKQGWKQP